MPVHLRKLATAPSRLVIPWTRSSQLSRTEIQRPSINPQPLPPHLHHNNQPERQRTDRRLDPEARLRPLGLRPRNLEVANDEPARRPRKIDPCGDLARPLGVRVQVVRRQRDGRYHDPEDIQAPCQGREHIVIPPLEAEAEEHEPGQHERGGEVDSGEADLGLEVPGVAADVACCDEVVEPVAGELAQQCGDDGREVEEADLLRAEVVERGEEDGKRGVDADDPGEGEKVVDGGDEDGGAGDDF
jgi:hypothetical protein